MLEQRICALKFLFVNICLYVTFVTLHIINHMQDQTDIRAVENSCNHQVSNNILAKCAAFSSLKLFVDHGTIFRLKIISRHKQRDWEPIKIYNDSVSAVRLYNTMAHFQSLCPYLKGRIIVYIAHKPESTSHDDVIKWKYFLRYWPFVPGIHGWSQRASDAEPWCFLWSAPE